MGPARSLSLDALVTAHLFVADRTKPVPRRAANALTRTTAEATISDRSDLMREAQRLRREWRRERYSRLKR